jgi:hypothetical protein
MQEMVNSLCHNVCQMLLEDGGRGCLPYRTGNDDELEALISGELDS